MFYSVYVEMLYVSNIMQ